MTFKSLLPALRSMLPSFAAKSGSWQQAWSRGEDVGGGSGGSKSCPNPAARSAWVFRCLQLIAGQVRSLPLAFYSEGKGGKQTPWTDPETLAFWRAPACTASGMISLGDFIELSLHWINLRGQACWVLDDTWLTAREKKSPILLAREDRLSPIKEGDVLVGWMFTDGAGARATLLPQQVIRPRMLNPFDDAAGLAPLEAARIAVDADYAAGVFARNVASSNGDQGVYVIAKGGAALSDAQREQIIAQLRQKAQLSKRGEYRPAFLTADVSVEDPKIKTVDAAFNEGRSSSRHEIFVAFGVPPSFSDLAVSNSIGSASDRYAFIENTCIPHSVRLCEAIALIERMRSGRALVVEQEWSKHPTMAQMRNERAKAAADQWKCGVPWSVLNQTHDLQMPEFAGWDSSWLPMSLERVTDEGAEPEPKEEPAPEMEEEGDAAKLLIKQQKSLAELRTLIAALPVQEPCMKAKLEHGGYTKIKCACANCQPETKKEEPGTEARDPARVKLWEKYMKARKPSEKLMHSKVSRAIMAARKETLAKLTSSEKALGDVRQRGVLDIIFDLSGFSLNMVEGTRAAHKDALDQALFQFAEEIGSTDPWKIEDPKVFTFLRTRENLIRDASRGIWNDIKSQLEKGLADGETNAQLADRVRSAFNGISKERADSIANTEVGAAYGFARHESMQGLGIDEKEWLSSGLDTVRDTHRSADGQRVPVDQPFLVPTKDGGEDEMMYPGDSNGSAGNVINCKCVSVAVMKED